MYDCLNTRTKLHNKLLNIISIYFAYIYIYIKCLILIILKHGYLLNIDENISSTNICIKLFDSKKYKRIFV